MRMDGCFTNLLNEVPGAAVSAGALLEHALATDAASGSTFQQID
ncbi:hypothetical protein OROMI_014320 [Orobanche minor]